jgi:hypothetical protein
MNIKTTNMNNKTNNGVSKLSNAQEEMRMQVIDLELKARYWKAQHDIRFYTLEAEKLQPVYDEYLSEQARLRDEAIADLEKTISEANKLAEEGKISVTEE